MTGTLYVVATPVGNLEDITLRALRVLTEVSVIAAEDTRHSRKLLAHYDIRTPLVSYWDQVERQKAPQLVARIAEGDSIALISDAGTPCIADPGYHLVRQAVAAGLRVVPVPGPSMVAAAVSVAALPMDRFVFEGFVPSRSAARRAFFRRLGAERRAVVCFETGRRLLASLRDLYDVSGECAVVVARETTKLYEEFLRGNVAEVLAGLEGKTVRGEVTLIIERSDAVDVRLPEGEMAVSIARLRGEGLGLKEVARRLAAPGGWSVREVYRLGVQMESAGRE